MVKSFDELHSFFFSSHYPEVQVFRISSQPSERVQVSVLFEFLTSEVLVPVFDSICRLVVEYSYLISVKNLDITVCPVGNGILAELPVFIGVETEALAATDAVISRGLLVLLLVLVGVALRCFLTFFLRLFLSVSAVTTVHAPLNEFLGTVR